MREDCGRRRKARTTKREETARNKGRYSLIPYIQWAFDYCYLFAWLLSSKWQQNNEIQKRASTNLLKAFFPCLRFQNTWIITLFFSGVPDHLRPEAPLPKLLLLLSKSTFKRLPVLWNHHSQEFWFLNLFSRVLLPKALPLEIPSKTLSQEEFS